MGHEVRLAELLATRLCHDLTGPIGAVNNGAEFLSEEGFDLQQQAVDLVVGSAQQAVIRLQFYRQAYGKVNYQGEASLTEVRELVTSFFKDTRFELEWPPALGDAMEISVSRKMAKLMLNMLIIISGVMPRGGTLKVHIEAREDGKSQVDIIGEAEMIKFDDDAKNAFLLQTDIEEITPKTVQPYFASKLAKLINTELAHKVEPNKFILTAIHD